MQARIKQRTRESRRGRGIPSLVLPGGNVDPMPSIACAREIISSRQAPPGNWDEEFIDRESLPLTVDVLRLLFIIDVGRNLP
jgi:hypothetical protein